jgi:hypothetical protein
VSGVERRVVGKGGLMGCVGRRIVPGQFLAVDPKGRSVMVGA